MSFNYDIKFKKLVRWLTPVPLRKPTWLIMLGVLVYPIAQLHQSLLLFIQAKLYQLKITPQVCYLEIMLRDAFDFTLRRIVIVDADWFPATMIFQEAELKPVILLLEGEGAPLIIYTESEAGIYQDDFVVQVPAGLLFDEQQMKGSINSYKLGGTKYKIEIV